MQRAQRLPGTIEKGDASERTRVHSVPYRISIQWHPALVLFESSMSDDDTGNPCYLFLRFDVGVHCPFS
jgi:hypothetical protein